MVISKKSDILVSVVIPIYNTEKYIDRCLGTIVNQTYKNIEIILVNDGSNDGSYNKCFEWSMKDQRVIIVNQSNKGLSEARNAGVGVSRGKYICFVDSDDWVDLDYIDYLLSLAIKYKADIVSCNYVRTKNDITSKKTNKTKLLKGQEITKLVLTSALKGDFCDVSCCTKLYRSCLISNQKFTPGLIYEDIVFNSLIAKNANVFVKSYDKKYKYFINDSSITSTIFSPKNYDLIVGAVMIRDSCFDNKELINLCNQYLAKCYYSLVIKMIKSGLVDKDSFLKTYYNKEFDKKLLFFSPLSFLRKIVLLSLLLLPKTLLVYVAGRKNGKK